MATSDNVLARLATDLMQYEYKDYITRSMMARDGMSVFRLFEANGMRSAEIPGGKGRTWDTQKILRASGVGSVPNSRSYSSLTSSAPSHKQLTMGYANLIMRAEVTLDELLDEDDNMRNYKFIGVTQEVTESFALMYAHEFPAIVFGDGTGKLSTYGGAGQTINAGVTGAVVVGNTNPFIVGAVVEKYTAVGVSEGVFRVVDAPYHDSQSATHEITLLNETGGNLAITSGGYFGIPNMSTFAGHGFQYTISDGTEADFDYYPRNIAANQTLQRSSTTEYAARAYRGIIHDANNAELSADMLDLISLKIQQLGKSDDLMLGPNDQVIGYKFNILCSGAQLKSYQRENRQVGRQYTLAVSGVEDNGLRVGAYQGWSFVTSELLPKDTAYLLHTPDWESSINEPEITSMGDYGVWQKAYGEDKAEHVRQMRWHLLCYNPCNNIKIVNLPGFTG